MAKTGKGISLLGLILLAVCFFLPQVKGCNETIVPAAATVKSGGGWLFEFGMPFLFAAVAVVFHGLRLLLASPKARRVIAVAFCVVCFLMLSYSFLLLASRIGNHMFGQDAEPDHPQWLSAVFILGLGGLSLAVIALAFFGRTSLQMSLATLACGAASLTYFLYWGVRIYSDTLYGLWLSVTACGLTILGSLLEAVWARPEP